MDHIVKSVSVLTNKQKAVQRAADDTNDWSRISRQVGGADSTIEMLLYQYETLQDEVNATRARIRTLGGHPVEPPLILADHPGSLKK